jgi:hypothetical protein
MSIAIYYEAAERELGVRCWTERTQAMVYKTIPRKIQMFKGICYR